MLAANDQRMGLDQIAVIINGARAKRIKRLSGHVTEQSLGVREEVGTTRVVVLAEVLRAVFVMAAGNEMAGVSEGALGVVGQVQAVRPCPWTVSFGFPAAGPELLFLFLGFPPELQDWVAAVVGRVLGGSPVRFVKASM